YGDPLDRDPSAVCADVLDGKISPAQALEAFGVDLTPDGAGVDDVKTKGARARRHRINWSAGSSTDHGIVTTSAFAVLRVITSSDFVGRCTGSSAGFAPLRILSTYVAA